jgi:hypothetical protein
MANAMLQTVLRRDFFMAMFCMGMDTQKITAQNWFGKKTPIALHIHLG